MKEKFAPEEWFELKLLPFNLYTLFMIQCFQDLAQDQMMMVLRAIENAHRIADPLHREVALDTPRDEWESLMKVPMKNIDSFIEMNQQGQHDPQANKDIASRFLLARVGGVQAFLSERLAPSEHDGYATSALVLYALVPYRGIGPERQGLADQIFMTLCDAFEVGPQIRQMLARMDDAPEGFGLLDLVLDEERPAGDGPLRSRLSPGEWDQVRLLPVLLFKFVLLRYMRAHPQAMPTEPTQFFFSLLTGGGTPLSPLYADLVGGTEPEEWMDLIDKGVHGDILELSGDLEVVGKTLSRILSNKEFNTIMAEGLTLGIGPFQSMGDDQEIVNQAFGDLVKLLEVDIEAGVRALRNLHGKKTST